MMASSPRSLMLQHRRMRLWMPVAPCGKFCGQRKQNQTLIKSPNYSGYMIQCLQLLFWQYPFNQPNFTMPFYYIKVPPHFSPPGSTLALTGALKWGTVWSSTSTGTGIVKGQSLSNQIYFTKKARSSLTFHNSCVSWGRTSYSTSF